MGILSNWSQTQALGLIETNLIKAFKYLNAF